MPRDMSQLGTRCCRLVTGSDPTPGAAQTRELGTEPLFECPSRGRDLLEDAAERDDVARFARLAPDVSFQTSLLPEPMLLEEGESCLVFGEHMRMELVKLVCLRPQHRFVQERACHASPSPFRTDTEAQLCGTRIIGSEVELADDLAARLGYEVNVAAGLEDPTEPLDPLVDPKLWCGEGVRAHGSD
jgi:hypothetical protein